MASHNDGFEGSESNIDLRDMQGGPVERGHSSLLIQELLAYAHHHKVASTSGWLSKVDKGHRDRQVGFYEKHGFKVRLDGDEGDIEWRNPELAAAEQARAASAPRIGGASQACL